VNDNIVCVDEHPIPRREPFDADVAIKSFFDLVRKLNGHGCDLPCRTAGGYHHMVRNVGFSDQRYGDNFLRLIIVERLKNELVKIIDVDGRFAGLA